MEWFKGFVIAALTFLLVLVYSLYQKVDYILNMLGGQIVDNMEKQSRNTIIGIPPELFLKAKSQAALQGKTIGQYVSEALAEKIHISDAGKK